MPNGNGLRETHFIWAWRLLIGILLAILSWYGAGVHTQVYSAIPDKIHKLEEKADATYVRKNRFDDFCKRLDTIDRKLDRLLSRSAHGD